MSQPPQAGAGVPALVPAFLVLAFFFGERFLRADFLVDFFFGDFFDEAFLAAFFFAAIWCGSFPMSARYTTFVRPLGRYQPGRDNTAGIVSGGQRRRQGESVKKRRLVAAAIQYGCGMKPCASSRAMRHRRRLLQLRAFVRRAGGPLFQ
jgi:hypothetical protein